MSQSFEHLVDLFAAIIIMFLFPLLYFGQKQDALVQTVVSTETDNLVSDIRSKGYLSKEMYDYYLEELSKTGQLYDISIEHRQKLDEPEYRFRTADEVKEEQDASFNGSNIYHLVNVTTQVPVVNDPVNGGPLNTETNESVLAAAVNTPASPAHVHTDACYLGTKHVHTGNPTTGGGCYGTYVSGGSCTSSTWTDAGTSGTYNSTGTCPVCHSQTQIITVMHYARCGNGHITTYTYYIYVSCTNCGYHYDSPGGLPTYTCGVSLPGHYSLSCGKTEGLYYDSNGQLCSPACSQIATGIIPTNPVQTVAIGDPLITTITASYLDGSTKVVVGSTNFSTAAAVQNATVTITYSYTISGTQFSKTCTITVTVVPRSKTCVNGHTYNLNADGSDPGCPYCRAWLRSLVVTYPITGSITIYKGTTLQDNGVTLFATYLDGHTQILYNEYVDNLDSNYVGSQNVTLSYKGKYVNLTVITKRNLKQCPVCHRFYELYPDNTDPGCPYCAARSPIFTGNVMEYYNKYYSDYILKELYEGSGTYYFADRDYLVINVKSLNKSWGQRLLSIFYKNLGDSGIQSVSEGYIREDRAGK